MLRSARPGPLAIVGTYRDTELGRRSPLTGALADLQRDGALDRIGLRGLHEDDVAALARELLGDAGIAARVHARTGGNAFFVEEVLRGLAEAGTPDVPESVRHAVGVRLSRLTDAANRLLAVAAIFGLEQDAGALQATAGLEPDVEEAALDEVLRARLLRPAATSRRFEFAARTRARGGASTSCNVLRRQRLHRRAADALTGLGENRHLEEIATHLFEAGDARRAAEMLARAGRRALDAPRLRGRRRALRPRARRARTRRRRPRGRTRPARPRQRAPARRRACRRARGLHRGGTARRRTHDAGLLGEAALGFAGLGIAIVDLDAETIARLEEALAAAIDPVLRSRLQARLAVELYYAPDRTRSEALSAAAVATARDAGNGKALASALNARHVALWRPDRVEDRLATAADMIAAARETGERHAELQARNWRVADLFELGDMPAFREEVARHARLADQLRLPSFQWYTPLWAAAEAMLAGRFDEADDLAAEAKEQGVRAGDRNAELFADMLLFTGQLERDEFDQVDLAFIEDKIAHSPAGPAYASSYAWVLAGLGETERARATLDRAIAHPHAFDANWMFRPGRMRRGLPAARRRDACGGFLRSPAALRWPPRDRRPCGRQLRDRRPPPRRPGRAARPPGRGPGADLGAAITRNHELGCTVWAEHAERWLAKLG